MVTWYFTGRTTGGQQEQLDRQISTICSWHLQTVRTCICHPRQLSCFFRFRGTSSGCYSHPTGRSLLRPKRVNGSPIASDRLMGTGIARHTDWSHPARRIVISSVSHQQKSSRWLPGLSKRVYEGSGRSCAGCHIRVNQVYI